MAENLNVKVGDQVAVTSYDWVIKGQKPRSLRTVSKITPKRIYIGDRDYFDRAGHGKRGQHITDAPAVIANLQAQIDQRKTARLEHERQQAERNARPTYQLACELKNLFSWHDPEQFEQLGEARLRGIIATIKIVV